MTMHKRRDTRTWWKRLAMVSVVSGLLIGSAEAFYFKDWPGSGVPRAQTLFNSQAAEIIGPSGSEPTPPGLTPPVMPEPNGPTSGNPIVPEPATGLLAGAGILLIAAGHRLRKKCSGVATTPRRD